MKQARKLIATLLLLCLGVSMFAACKSGDSEQSNTPSESVSNPAGSEDTSRVLEIPEGVTYDGYEFIFLVGANVAATAHIFEAQSTEDHLSQAISKRNAAIEEKYDIKIVESYHHKHNVAGAGSAYNEILKSYNSQDVLYDAAVAASYDCGTLSSGGMIADLRDYGYVNLNKAWWDQPANEQLTVYGSTYFTAGDISYIDDDFTYAIIFNKEIAKSLKLEDMYQLVRDGKWTYDKLYRFSKQAKSLDSTDGLSDGDVYGFLGYSDTIWMSFSSIGATVAAVNDDSKLELTLNSERNFNQIKAWTEFGHDECFIDWQRDPVANAKGWAKVYQANQTLFFGATVNGIYVLRDTETDYGFLPWPKFDEEQTEYYSGMAPNHISLFCIPNVGDDDHIERTSILVEAISSESNIITDAFYTKNLQGKSVRDDDSLETLKIIFENKVFDIGFYFNVGGMRGAMWTNYRNDVSDFSSTYASKEESAIQKIDEINMLYQKHSN